MAERVLPQRALEEQLLRALDRHQGASSASWLGALLLGVALAVAGVALAYIWSRQEQARQRLLEAARLADSTPNHLEALLKSALPAWVMSPDCTRVEWMNALLAQLWPHIERAGGKLLMKDNLLEGLLNSTTFWRPSILMNAQLHVAALAFGQEPPRITGVKTFPRQNGLQQDEVLMEYNFVWSSKMECKLLLKLLGKHSGAQGLRSLFSSLTRLKVGVSNLVARGTLRVALKPLLDEMPIVSGIKISFMDYPDFSYQTRILGGNPYLVPGVKQLVDSFIRDRLLTPLSYPDGFTYDLVTRSMAAQERPEGLLEVTVVEATGVPRMDTFGKSDPYCQVWVRHSHKLRTTIKSGTLKPVWNEIFTFMVHSSVHQSLTLALFDSDFWTDDDFIGQVNIPLSSLDLSPGVVNDLWLPVPRAAKRGEADDFGTGSQGRVHVVRASTAAAAAEGSQQEGALPTQLVGDGGAACVHSGSLPASFSSAAAAEAADAVRTSSGLQRRRAARAAGALERQRSSVSNGSTSSAAAWSQQLRQLASNPLDILRSKQCMLHVTATYFVLTDQDIAEIAEGQRQGVDKAPSLSLPGSIPRVQSILRSGILYVWLDRATNLKSKAGFTRNMRINVRVGPQIKTTERGTGKLQQRENPIFEEMVELIVDAHTAQRSNSMVHVELFTDHFLRKASFHGRVSIPLAQVIERRQLRDSWPLQDSEQGTITMELSWLSALSM